MNKDPYAADRRIQRFAGEEIAERAGDFAPGARVGKYRLIRKIGKGGMAVVYEAEDAELERRVALKIIAHPEESRSDFHRFQREATIAAQFQHPNIVAVHEAGLVRDREGAPTYFIAMDLVNGRTFSEVLRDRRVPQSKLLEMLEQIARALDFAHSKGVIHRDVKPDNVLVDGTGRVLLGDFGLAHGDWFQSKLTRSNTVLGTPLYMAPEQIEGKAQEIGRATDVYALGVILYEILTGHPPFKASTLEELYRRILQDDPPRPGSVKKTVSPDLEVVSLKALDKDPLRRYPTARDFAEELARHRRGEPILAKPISRLHRWGRSIRRHRKSVAFLLSAILILGGGIGWGVRSGLRGKSFRAARDSARRAFEVRDWPRALFESERALEVQFDADLIQVRDAARKKIEDERTARELQDRVAPLEAMIRETRPLFYVAGLNLQDRLRRIEASLECLQRELGDPRLARSPIGWRALGIGRYFLGDDGRAEEALARAEAQDSEDAWVAYYLGRIHLERSLYAPAGRRFGSRDAATRWEMRRAADYFNRPSKDWEGAAPIDRHLCRTYLAAAERRFEEALSLCTEGLQLFKSDLGSEEYCVILALIVEKEKKLEFLGRAFQRRPHYALAHLVGGDICMQRGDTERAMVGFNQAIELQPRWTVAYALRGACRGTLQGDYAGAVADFSKAIELAPSRWDLYSNRAVARFHQGDPSGATEDFAKAIELDPRPARGYGERAKMRYLQGELAASMEDLDEALRIEFCSEYLVIRSKVWWAMSRFHEALLDAEKALQEDPGSADALCARGHARYARGDVEGAIQDYRAALKAEPETQEARMLLCEGLLAQGAVGEASAVAAEGIRMAPGDDNWHMVRAGILARQGRLDEALAEVELGVKAGPHISERYARRGMLRYAREELDLALADFEKGMALNPRNYECYLGRAMVILARDTTTDVRLDLNRVIELVPHLAEAYFLRGIASKLEGNLEEALPDFDQALRLKPGFLEALQARGDVRRRLGNVDGAVADWKEALRAAPPDWNKRAEVEASLRSAKSGD